MVAEPRVRDCSARQRRDGGRLFLVDALRLSSGAPLRYAGANSLLFYVVSELPFSSFPWFKGAALAQITNVQRPSDQHLYWPDLDVDLSVESIRSPEAFPLVSRPLA